MATPGATIQTAINACRNAMSQMLEANNAYLIANEAYVALDLGSVEDSDFSDGLTAQEFVDAVGNMGTVSTAISAGVKTNLNKAAL